MSAALNTDTNSHQEFTKGVSFEIIPPAVRAQGQIVRNFGMMPPAYWLEAQKSQMSTPGPMTGGAPILSPNQFSHGVMW